MKNLYLIGILALLFGCSTTQKLESDQIENKSFTLEPFSAISVNEGVEVVLHQSFDHRAEAKSNFIEYVRLKVNDGTLIIDIDEPSNSVLKKNKTKIEVWANNVNRFQAASNAKLVVDGRFKDDEQQVYASSTGKITYNADCKNLTVEASSAGVISGNLKVNHLQAAATSKGILDLRGKADHADLNASSKGNIKARRLNADHVLAQATSKGDIEIGINKDLKGDVSSGGIIKYKANGNIKLGIDKSSGGSVKELKGIL
ncbi:MAG: DUF2807 domain-containing protein [Flavobacteriaceae bacterium]|nr:DUF2807 domain-containing protein [Flavobacteriaceae bacterium]